MDRTESAAGSRNTVGGAGSGVNRRSVVAGAVWSIPVVAMMSASPAFAVSGDSLSLSTPSMQVPASGSVPMTALVKNPSGVAVPGAAVSFSGPSGSAFTPTTATTDGSGAAVTQLDLGTPWATPGSMATVTAVGGSGSTSQSFTVVGSNLVVAGKGYSSFLAQSERVFPSPVVDALSMGSRGVNPCHLALLADGSVWAKGSNRYGQLGDGSRADRSTWGRVPLVSGATRICAGSASAYALLADGSVKAWGSNSDGQLGDNTTTDRSTPVQVSGLASGVAQIAAGFSSAYARRSDGSVVAWGSNFRGALGDGSETYRSTPVAVSTLSSGVRQIAAGQYSGYALSTDGSVKAWGYNDFLQLGDGSTTSRSTPVQVSGLTGGVAQIAASGFSAYALGTAGWVKAWGDNGVGQLGDGSWSSRSTPVQVSGLTSGVAAIASSYQTAYALSSSGSMRAWGYNGDGAVGDGTTVDRNSPQTVVLPAGGLIHRLGADSSTGATTMVVLKTG